MRKFRLLCLIENTFTDKTYNDYIMETCKNQVLE